MVEGAALHLISKSQSSREALWQSLTTIPKHTTAWFVSSFTPRTTQQWLAACLLQQQMDNLVNVQITKCHLKKGEGERKWENSRESMPGRKPKFSIAPVTPAGCTYKPIIKCYFWVLSQRQPFSGETFHSRSTQSLETQGKSKRWHTPVLENVVRWVMRELRNQDTRLRKDCRRLEMLPFGWHRLILAFQYLWVCLT